MGERQIYATYDDQGIFVYQAYSPLIARAALEAGTFSTGFKLERMTWIKPSLGWMLYRSGYATKPGQEMILKIKLSHEGFLTILRAAAASSYQPVLYEDEAAWKTALRASTVRYQWDPDHDLALNPVPHRRAIQLGLTGEIVPRYVHEWIIGLEDMTELARAVKDAHARQRSFPNVPAERVYPVDADLAHTLGITRPVSPL